MENNLELVEQKAAILIDALPYIRDFNQKTIVIEYGCGEWLSGVEEKRLMQDIVLLKSIGMRPIVVHDTRMGMDKFRENKRIAKLLELCGVKAVGICGVDVQTLNMILDNDYIPVIVPNDIDNETEYIDPRDTALEIAEKMQADKLVYLSRYPGIFKDESRSEVYSRLTVPEVEKIKAERHFPEEFGQLVDYGIRAAKAGVNRAHILDGRIRHVLLIEFFSVVGAGTIIISDEGKLYGHELDERREA
ncbi:MAG: acetylglutamate kinase [Coprococcus sp.]|nr:acetylglutamate kinase [Coprococcus sp.]